MSGKAVTHSGMKGVKREIEKERSREREKGNQAQHSNIPMYGAFVYKREIEKEKSREREKGKITM